MEVQMTIKSLDTDHKGFSRSESESPRETFAVIFGVGKAGLQSFMDILTNILSNWWPDIKI